MRLPLASAIVLSAWMTGCGTGTERPPPGSDDDSASEGQCSDASFVDAIEPTLKRYCLQCHSAGTALGEFSVHSWQAVVLGGGMSGPAVVPGDCASSELYLRITGQTDNPMPPSGYGTLTQQEIDCICTWIDDGCPED